MLSTAVDLIMLHEFVETYGQGVAPDAIERLQHTIDAQLDQIMGDARKAAAKPFRARSKQFCKRVSKAVRRDLAPAAAPVENPRGD